MRYTLPLVRRNIKLFFKDKGMFFTALITPAILLVLYATFLKNVYRDAFLQSFPAEITVSESIISGLVGAQLISSLLAVSCVTVSFCANFLMVSDKVSGAAKDFAITPVKPHVLSLGYYIATLASSLIICYSAMAICLVYVWAVGWYMTLIDVLALAVDVFLLTLFGTALSSIISFFLSSQGQISAVGTIVSSGYGFICGAYMPISTFSMGLRRVISFLPGTYGTALVRNHAMRGALSAMNEEGVPTVITDEIKDAVDCNLYFFENAVPTWVMTLVLVLTCVALIGIYVLMNTLRARRKRGA